MAACPEKNFFFAGCFVRVFSGQGRGGLVPPQTEPSRCRTSLLTVNIAIFHNLPSGGALRILREKVRLFKEMSHRVHVFTFSTAERELFPLEGLADSLTVEPLNFKGLGRFQNYLTASRNLANKINALGADRVWVEKCRFVGSPSVLRFLQKPAIFYMQEPLRIRKHEVLATDGPKDAPPYSGPALNARELVRKILKAPDHFFIKHEDRKNALKARVVYANSNFSAGWIKRVYGIETKVLYQGVDTDFFIPQEAAPENFVLSVGRLDPVKGYDFLLASLSLIPERVRPGFSIVCDSVDQEFMKDLETDALKKNITLRIDSNISDEALRALYGRCALVLCAAHHEPFGLVPLEAMACGVPVVAVNEGGFAETVRDKKTGYLLDRNENLWAQTIETLLSDPPVCLELGNEGRQEVVRRWGMNLFRQRLEQSLV